MTDRQDAAEARAGWRRLPGLVRLALGSGCVLLIAGAGYVLAFAASRLASLLIALVASLLIAALLDPVMHVLRRLRLPQAAGALTAVLLLLAAFVAPVALLWNVAADQYGDLAQRFRDGVARLRGSASQILPIDDAQVNEILDDLERRFEFGTNAVSGALTLVEVLAAVTLALFVAFFVLKDGRVMWDWFLDQLPARTRPPVDEIGAASWDTVCRYIRGILIVAVIDAAGIGIGLALIGVPFALPLALLVLVGGFVPYVGATVSGSVAVLVALAANGPLDALLTIAVVIAVQQLEGNLLEPFIVGHQVRLHPVVVVVAVFAGALIAGIAGAIISVPLVAVAYRALRVRRAQLARDPFADSA